MGQKVNPIGFRLGINHTWKSRWFCDRKKYSDFVMSDILIRKMIIDKFGGTVISNIIIERLAQKVCISIYSPKPGLIVGKKSSGLESLKSDLYTLNPLDYSFNIIEIIKPDLDSKTVAFNIAKQLEKRISFKKVLKRAVMSAIKSGAKGVKICCSGRIGGAEIARSEYQSLGSIPLHTLKADVDYARATANTDYGSIGVKVWIYLGDISCYDIVAYDKKLS